MDNIFKNALKIFTVIHLNFIDSYEYILTNKDHKNFENSINAAFEVHARIERPNKEVIPIVKTLLPIVISEIARDKLISIPALSALRCFSMKFKIF